METDTLAFPKGPSAAERVEMFNSVSKATAENAELAALFAANAELLHDIQKVLADLSEAAVDKGELSELQSTAKYASETSSAMKAS